MKYSVGDVVMLHHVSDEEMDFLIVGCPPGWVVVKQSNTYLHNNHPNGVRGEIVYMYDEKEDVCPYQVSLDFEHIQKRSCVYVNEINIRPINKKQLQLEVVL